MHSLKLNFVVASIVLLLVAGLATAAVAKDGPDLPSPLCDRVQVPEGNKVAFHVYADGVQIYTWNGAGWVFVEPAATLFANAEFDGKVGTHYRGPTWESNSGSTAVGARLFGCTPDPTAIPWLLLQAVSNGGHGIFSSVTYIQRVNTTGGVAPAVPGSSVGETVQIPYTAEYYFYRAQ